MEVVFIAWILIRLSGTENQGSFDSQHNNTSKNSFGIFPLKYKYYLMFFFFWSLSISPKELLVQLQQQSWTSIVSLSLTEDVTFGTNYVVLI